MHPGVHAKSRADQPAFIMAQTGIAVTYAELEQRINLLAHFLRSRGLKRLDHYAIFMENNDRYIESCGAGERAGIFPREIEDVLAEHSDVAMVAVVGVPDDKWGEAVTAIIVARGGSNPNPDD